MYSPRRLLWHAQAFRDAGWTRREVVNIPNALSMARLLSGPLVAQLIMTHQWPAALTTLAIAGASDWADGWAAKHWGQSSVLGSYLDPLADKVLVGCTVGALAAEVSRPAVVWPVSVTFDSRASASLLCSRGMTQARCKRLQAVYQPWHILVHSMKACE